MLWKPEKHLTFFKYHGTGNDFILVDQRDHSYLDASSERVIRLLCDRHFGIGADGLILLELDPGLDFRMVYFNSDGRESSMCGNGGRCLLAFANHLGMIGSEGRFRAIDGIHEGRIRPDGWVDLKMADVRLVERTDNALVLDTGSPHYVSFVQDAAKVDVFAEGRKVRYSDRFREQGINVNFVSELDRGICVSTYERGVEQETLSCGTGVTAAALAWALQQDMKGQCELPVKAKGGDLLIRFDRQGESFTDIWLCGPAIQVFRGELEQLQA